MTYLERKMPADVPLHRGSVGAMGLNTPALPERPYVYRGSKTTASVLARQTVRRAAEKREQKAAERKAQVKRVKDQRKIAGARRLQREARANRKRARQALTDYMVRVQDDADARSKPLDISDPRTWENWKHRAPEPDPFLETPPKPKPASPSTSPSNVARFKHAAVVKADLDDILSDDD